MTGKIWIRKETSASGAKAYKFVNEIAELLFTYTVRAYRGYSAFMDHLAKHIRRFENLLRPNVSLYHNSDVHFEKER